MKYTKRNGIDNYRNKNGVGQEFNRCPKCSKSLYHDDGSDSKPNPRYKMGEITYTTSCENKLCDYTIKEIYTFNRIEEFD